MSFLPLNLTPADLVAASGVLTLGLGLHNTLVVVLVVVAVAGCCSLLGLMRAAQPCPLAPAPLPHQESLCCSQAALMQQQAAVASPLPWALRELVASGVSSPLRPGPAHNCWTGPTSA